MVSSKIYFLKKPYIKNTGRILKAYYMDRKKKFFLNGVTGVAKQVVTVLCGFILPRYLLLFYGSSVNGLVSSITHFLSFISLLDMGVGAVVQANLYKPLADQDRDQISRIVKASERFFKRLGLIFSGYIIVLCFVYPSVINSDFDFAFSATLILIISGSMLAEYLYGMTYQLLLNADQRAYIPQTIQIATIILNTVLSVVLMYLGASFHVVKLASAAVFVLRPLLQMLYVRKHYSINRQIVLHGEPIKQKWNGFSQHFASVVCMNIDVAVLTVFSTLLNVSVYSVYYNITYGVAQIIMTAATGLESLFGNMISRNEKEELQKVFDAVEWIVHFGITIIFTIAGITLIPFVTVYTKGITDANYIHPLFGALLTAAYASQCLRIPYFRLIKAAGHFKQTQNGSYISAGLNCIISIILVFEYGLVGTAIGTLVAMFYHTCYLVWYLRKEIVRRPVILFLKYLFSDVLTVALIYYLTRGLINTVSSYTEWMILAIKISLVALPVSFAVSFLLFREKIGNFVKLIREKRTD